MSSSSPASPLGAPLKTILIIDDDVHLAATLTLGLETNGYRVLSAPDAASGWNMAHVHLPDLVLCDIDMPDKDGRRLLREMQADTTLAGRQFVLMTGKEALGSARAAMDLGADDFLLKPFSLKELLSCVDARLRRAEVSRRVDSKMVEQLRESLHSTLPQQFFTPLASIMGLTELLQTQLDILTKDEIRQDLYDIRGACRRLHRTIRNYLLILELDASESPRSRLALGSTEVGKAMTAGLQAAVKRHRRADDVVAELAAGDVKVDPMDLTVLVEELVDNALAYSRRGTKVQVRSWTDAGRLHVTVTDTGRGMTPEQLTHLGAFWQPEHRMTGHQGLGLGVALVRKLAHHLGGDFHIESEAGKGTTGHFSLPVAEA